MGLPVIVCDDSKFARAQLIRALPSNLKQNLKEAADGEQALELIKSGFGELMFLDLNMPNMDGYQVLEEIKKNQYDVLVIVITGDIQSSAEKRIMSLGALAYLKKPLDVSLLFQVLDKYGLAEIVEESSNESNINIRGDWGNGITYMDKLQEVINIATGQAAKQLADMLNIFITLPIPKVSYLSGKEIYECLHGLAVDSDDILISTGFVGSNMNGEILISFSKECIDNLLALIIGDVATDTNRRASIIDVSNLILSTLMNGIGEFLGAQFTRSHPSVVRLNDSVQLISPNLVNEKILNVKMIYSIPKKNIECVLYLLFTEDALPSLTERLSYI
jgi:CheY-like chemotaxis protein